MKKDRLIELVPSMESCMRIPSGQLADTALVWLDACETPCFWDGDDGHGGLAGGVKAMKLPARVRPRNHCMDTAPGLHPAPTVRETLFDLLDKGYRDIYLNCCCFPSTCTCRDPQTGEKISRGGNTPEEAALSLWLYLWTRHACLTFGKTSGGVINDD